MSAPMNARPIVDGTMTGTSVITGTPVDVRDCPIIAFQYVWTGTPSGTVSFDASESAYADAPAGTHEGSSGPTWTTVTATTAGTNPAGSASSSYWRFDNVGYRFIRPKYTNATGTGTLNVFVSGKGAK